MLNQIKSTFQKNLNYTVVETIAPNKGRGNNCYELENSLGGLMIDNEPGEMSMVAVAFTIDELTSIYNREVNNNTLEFYKD